VGRSIRDISTKTKDEDIYQDAESVMDTLQGKDMEVETTEGRWLLMRFMPYRTRDNVIEGVVITITDISSIKEAEERAKEMQLFNENILDSLRESLLILDKDLKVEAANKSFYKKFQVLPKETEGKYVYELGNGQWDIPELRKLLEKIIPKKAYIEDYMVEHDFPKIGRRKMMLNARRLQREKSPAEYMILLAIEDVPEK
jgi:two-component system CheB/CheR fusion protein